jgi:hypothetical protein
MADITEGTDLCGSSEGCSLVGAYDVGVDTAGQQRAPGER